MQVVPVEPMVWPESLFQDAASQDTLDVRWWVLHTRPRTEKALARRLLPRNISYFLPVYERRRRLQRRMVRTQLPLFPGYLFLHGDGDARRAALETNLVVRCLHIEDQQDLETDLERLHDLIQSGKPLSPEGRLQAGMPARIISGPLAGLEGRIIRTQSAAKFLVAVNFLQQGASMEVDISAIRPL